MSVILPILQAATGLSERDLRAIIANAPSRYKNYSIPKRNGGLRMISQPAKEVKSLQRALSDSVLSALPVHSSAMAYRPGLSIFHNAARHARNGPILKFDFVDFFPSIKATDWVAYCKRNSLFHDEEDILISTRILFRRARRGHILRLAIGAPSSPHLSNVLMHDFDKQICDRVLGDKVTYTRYADDLTFSAKRTGYFKDVEYHLRAVIREIRSPSLRLNAKKTVSATMKYRRIVTGLVLANDHTVSLGHERKRRISSAVNHARYGKLSREEIVKLAGTLAFVSDIEPTFLDRLKRKYGDELINEIKYSTSAGS